MANVKDAGRRSEADNIAQLGNYAFVYGLLLALGVFALLCLMMMLGLPLEGPVSAGAITRTIFRGLALCAFLFGLYAVSCGSTPGAGRSWVSMAQLSSVATIFLACGINYVDASSSLIGFLQWLGTDCGVCKPFPIA